jgi:quercetin dioxygenase-like cupin family protein
MVQTFLGMVRTILIQLNNMENTKKTFGSSKKFINGNALEWETVGEGVKRKIMGYDDKIMLVKVHFDEGGIGQMHEHYHSQVTYVESGAFEVTIDGKTELLKGGDSFYIPPHDMHGAICKESGVLIDVFSPIREDFME